MATKYIATTGNDTTGDGSSGNPWLTLAKALTGTSAGDTISCAAGTYTFTDATVAGRTIQGATGGSASSTTGWTVFDGSSANKTWTLTNATTTMNNIWFQNIGTSSTTKNVFATNGDYSNTINLNRCRFSNCVVYSYSTFNGLLGLYLAYSTGPGILSVTITSCVFDNLNFSSSSGNYPGYFSMRNMPAGSTFKWYNSVFIIRSAPSGIANGIFVSYNDTTNITWTFKNGIFRNTSTAVNFYGAYTSYGSMTATNCIFDANIGNTSNINKTNCLTGDPLFIDESNNDFRLRPTSPCIDTGVVI